MNLILTNARLVTLTSTSEGYTLSTPKSVVIQSGKIKSIDDATLTHAPEFAHYPVINCRNRVVTPGLIDCHTHLIYAGNRANEFEMRLQGIPYQEIAKQGGGILSTVHATREASEKELVELALPRLDGLLASGVTSIEVKSGYGLTLQDELKMLRAAKQLTSFRRVNVTTTLLAAHALPPEFSDDADAYIDYVCNEVIPAVAEENLADAVDVFCESIGFNLAQTEEIFKAAKQYNLPVKGHMEQLSNLGGSSLAAKYNALSVDHIEYLDDQGIADIAASNTVATLLPGAFYFLKETQLPPIEKLRKHNIPMALSTDLNPGTSPFSDLTLMMNMGCTLFGLTPEESLRGVTTNAAQAIGQSDSIGQIAVGFNADLAIWDIDHPAELSYQFGNRRLFKRIVAGIPAHD